MTLLEDLLLRLAKLREKGEDVQIVGEGCAEGGHLPIRILVEYNDGEFIATFTYVREDKDEDGDGDKEEWEPCYACEMVFRRGEEWHAHYPADAVKVLADDIRERLGDEGFVYLRRRTG
jgi:hypothetical protein